MSLLEAIFLGIVQGATEFLPVSSSGHSVLLPALLNMPNAGLDLIAIAHQGTLLAVLVYFRQDLWHVFQSMLRGLRERDPLKEDGSRLAWYLIVATIPVALTGLLLEDFIESIFARPIFAAIFLLVTAVLLFAGERLLSGDLEIEKMNGLDALSVGIFQMVALLPGVSRSGSTIAGGLWRGLDRAAAARFSFLLGVPAIAGAGIMTVLDIQNGGLDRQMSVYAGTFIAAAITGYLSIHFMLSWLRRHSLIPFAVYCALLGIVCSILVLAGVL